MKYDELISVIPKEQLNAVFNSEYCDIDAEFLGFTHTYKQLASIIPKHFTVIDLGCAYAAQCYYFAKHKRYIGVDAYPLVQFHTDNTSHYHMSIQKFISDELPKMELDMKRAFAICSYVPDFEAQKLVRSTFPNVFNFYPAYEISITTRRPENDAE